MLNTATLKLQMNISSGGSPVDPSTYAKIEVYLIDSFSFDTIAKYTTDYDSTQTEFKELEISGNNVIFVVDPEDTQNYSGNVKIQPVLYSADADYEGGFQKQSGQAVCLKLNKAK